MKRSHTPGPWCIDAMGTICGAKTTGEPRHVVAKEFTSFADARLISAAPEMLLALEAVRHLINCSDFHDASKRLEVWSKVDEAMAKARGGK